MMKVAALGNEPKRHNNLVAGQRRVPPRTLKLWRAWIFMSWSVARARRTLLMSEMRVQNCLTLFLSGDQASV